MANLCSTQIRISADLDKIKRLKDDLEFWMSELSPAADIADRYVDPHWLGNIAAWAGVITEPIRNDEGIGLGGEVCDCEISPHNELIVDVSDKWNPHIRIWDMICKAYLQDYVLYYDGIEKGCRIFNTNDPEVWGLWYFDNWDEPGLEELGYYSNDYYSEKDVMEMVNFVITGPIEFEEKLKTFEEMFPNCSLGRWQYVGIESCV